MQEKTERPDNPAPTKGTPGALKDKESPAPDVTRHDPVGSSTAPNIMEHAPSGSGAAAARSSKGGKSGGGMGGQQAGGIKGGGKRKTHAGRK